MLVIAVAARPPAWLAKLEAEYAERIVGFDLKTRLVKPATEAKTTAAVIAQMPPKAEMFLLDADGKMMDSDGFAHWLEGRLHAPHPTVFVIGGAAGAPQALRTQARGVISLSKMTFAHAAARLILAEQLFRADCLMRGHPYPK